MKVKEESEKAGLKLNIQKTKVMVSGPITYGKQMGKQWKQCQTLFFWAPKSQQMVTAAMKFLLLRRKAMTNLDSKLKSRRHYFADKGPSSQDYGFSSGHVCM